MAQIDNALFAHQKSVVLKKLTLSDTEINTLYDTVYFGMYDMTPELHSHPFFEIQIGIDGSYNIETADGNTYNMKKDMFCLIPPGCLHCTHSDDEIHQKLAMRFRYQQTAGKGMTAFFHRFDGAMTAIREPVYTEAPALCELIKTIHRELVGGSDISYILSELLTKQLYVGILRLCTPHAEQVTSLDYVFEDDHSTRACIIERYLSDHYMQQITESDLARLLKLSKRQTSREMRSLYGMSFHEKLTSIRMLKSAKLLTRTDSPISEIAATVGFTSVPGFYATFKKFFGIAPKQFRKMNEGDMCF